MSTGTQSRGRDAPDGRLRLRRDDHEVAQAAGRADRARRAAARDLDRQGGYRGAEPRRGGRGADPGRRGSDGRGRDGSRGDRPRRGAVAEPAPAPVEPAPCPLRPRRAAPEPVAAAPAPTPPRATPLRPRSSAASGNGRTFVSPVVARIAAEHGVDPGAVPGTGQGGRVTKKDILTYIEQGPPAAAPATCGATLRPARTTRRRPGCRRTRSRLPAPAPAPVAPAARTGCAASAAPALSRRQPQTRKRHRARSWSRSPRCAAA